VTTLSLRFDAPANDLNNVMVYPNPFRPSEGQTAVTFDGLPQDTRIDIYTVSGRPVWEITAAQAGQCSWDGRNDRNELVASGLYLFVAKRYSDAGGWQYKQGKVAVVR
jgi:hypothetical protein